MLDACFSACNGNVLQLSSKHYVAYDDMQMIVVGNAAYDGKQLMPNNALPVFAMQA
jgi:UPF0288 family protein (methanogenesis marker protein 3)